MAIEITHYNLKTHPSQIAELFRTAGGKVFYERGAQSSNYCGVLVDQSNHIIGHILPINDAVANDYTNVSVSASNTNSSASIIENRYMMDKLRRKFGITLDNGDEVLLWPLKAISLPDFIQKLREAEPQKTSAISTDEQNIEAIIDTIKRDSLQSAIEAAEIHMQKQSTERAGQTELIVGSTFQQEQQRQADEFKSNVSKEYVKNLGKSIKEHAQDSYTQLPQELLAALNTHQSQLEVYFSQSAKSAKMHGNPLQSARTAATELFNHSFKLFSPEEMVSFSQFMEEQKDYFRINKQPIVNGIMIMPDSIDNMVEDVRLLATTGKPIAPENLKVHQTTCNYLLSFAHKARTRVADTDTETKLMQQLGAKRSEEDILQSAPREYKSWNAVCDALEFIEDKLTAIEKLQNATQKGGWNKKKEE